MSDPISVRHVMAATDVTERINKAEAANQQALSEEFTKELSKQEMMRQTRVNKEDDKSTIRDDETEKERERRRRKAKRQREEGEDDGTVEAEASSHIIDLTV